MNEPLNGEYEKEMAASVLLNANRIQQEYKFKELNVSRGYLILKRLIDVIGSVVGMIVLSPVLIIIATLIKLEDPKGAVFFCQKRVGKNGKQFKMYKFRSMVHNAEKLKETLMKQNDRMGPMFKMKNDPRVTRVGKFIRKTSIDEIPQLINILRGEMSFVGPRPSLQKEVLQFEPWMMKRLDVKPGLTCYWQVYGRNNVEFEEWMKLDIKYIEERNIFIDIKLIFKTFAVFLGDKSAS